MKKLLCLLTLLLFVCVCAQAEETHDSGDYSYILLEDGTARITEYRGKRSTLTIPETLGAYQVTSVGALTFFACPGLTSVTIPDSVTDLEGNPFSYCGKLAQVSVSSEHPTLATINGVLFHKADKRLICVPRELSVFDYAIPQGIRAIGDNAFYGCKALHSIVIPDSVTAIGDGAFSYCTALKSVDVPASVTSIGARAFTGCERLAAVALPESLAFIGDEAFSYCDALTDFTIPDSVVNIGANPFEGCDRLMQIGLSPDHPTLMLLDGVLFSRQDMRLICYPATPTKCSYTVPDGVTSIGDYAFANCDKLTAVTLPEGVTSIGYRAFSYCDALTAVTLPDSLTDLSEFAFADCKVLENIALPGSITVIRRRTFNSCPALTDVTIPGSVTSIEEGAFANCNALWRVIVQDGVTTIGHKAFDNCPNLISVVLPDSVTFIKDSFFRCPYVNFTVPRGSYAAEYAASLGLPYTYPDANDWLTN